MTSKTAYPNWQVAAGRLMYCPEPGKAVYPSANEIWASVFTGNSATITDWALSPTESLPELEFSRFPAEPALIVSGNLLEGLRTELAVSIGSDIAPLVWTEGSVPPDQVVAECHWFPVDAASVA